MFTKTTSRKVAATVKVPSVTFIIAARDAAATIRCSVESVLKQDYLGRFEVVVVDDASTDATPEIVSEYPAVKLLRNNQNLGRSLSRNLALGVVDTALVAIQDADDYSEPNRLSNTVPLMGGSDKTIVGGQLAWVDMGSGAFEGGTWPTGKEETMNLLVKGRMPVAHPTMIIATNMMRSVDGYNPRYPVGEDLDLLLRLKKKYPDLVIVNSTEKVAQYNRSKSDRLSYIGAAAFWRQQVMNSNVPVCERQAHLSWVKNAISGYVRQRARAVKGLASGRLL